MSNRAGQQQVFLPLLVGFLGRWCQRNRNSIRISLYPVTVKGNSRLTDHLLSLTLASSGRVGNHFGRQSLSLLLNLKAREENLATATLVYLRALLRHRKVRWEKTWSTRCLTEYWANQNQNQNRDKRSERQNSIWARCDLLLVLWEPPECEHTPPNINYNSSNSSAKPWI